MNKNSFFKLVVAIAVSEAAGVAGSIFTVPAIRSGWYANLIKPEIAPPNSVFGPVWTALYFLIGISLFLAARNGWLVKNEILLPRKKAWNRWSERLWSGDLQKQNIIAIFAVQYFLNIIWTPVFFGLRNIGAAFFVLIALWCAIIYLIINFYRVSRPAAWLLLPYILWVTFALYLNFVIWMIN